jgi:undecaprenyl phosphate N,N'-diacetylbacillosamine 1-phosphate transferase
MTKNYYTQLMKPIIDFIMAIIGLLIFAPFIVIITILLVLSHQSNPFFIQPRTGKDKEVFHILKFKTMRDKRDPQGKLLPDAHRITSIGKWLRKTSLDEIPQLINVLKGDMSLVGPRPLLTDYAHLYNDVQNRRHEIKPGLTGWVQINGRNSISWDERFKMDVWYVEHIGFLLDIKILLKTIIKVLRRDDINTTDISSIEPFEGKY